MNIKFKLYDLPIKANKLYDIILNEEEVETLVTHHPGTVKSWINNIEDLHECRLNCLIVSLDVEWRPNVKVNCNHPIATLQLCVSKTCLIFQILHAPKIPRLLRVFLGNPDYTFVGVGIKNDVKKLWDDYGLEVANTRDLRSWAAKELDRKELRGVGLKELVKDVVGRIWKSR